MASPSRSDRNFRLVIGTNDSTAVIIKPPLNVIFDGDKSAAGFGLNKLNLTIPNLKESNRLAMVKDAEQFKRIPVLFEAGYGPNLEKIYQGNIHRGAIVRQGSDINVNLECIDGGFDALNSFTSQTVKGRRLAVDKILEDMPNITVGKITDQESTIRPHVLVGSSYQQLLSLVADDEELFIDNEKLFILKKNEVVSLFVPRVDFESGLMNTPERENSIVTFETMLNPALRVGGLCNLQSQLAKYLNGVYKINTINYSGDYYGDNWRQTVSAFQAPNFTKVA